MKYPLSTVQVAKLLGMHQSALQRLIREKRVTPPTVKLVGGMRIRLWKKKDVNTAKAALKRQK
jgi:predicted DNA-binding transcriptional regulator AlpA